MFLALFAIFPPLVSSLFHRLSAYSFQSFFFSPGFVVISISISWPHSAVIIVVCCLCQPSIFVRCPNYLSLRHYASLPVRHPVSVVGHSGHPDRCFAILASPDVLSPPLLSLFERSLVALATVYSIHSSCFSAALQLALFWPLRLALVLVVSVPLSEVFRSILTACPTASFRHLYLRLCAWSLFACLLSGNRHR